MSKMNIGTERITRGEVNVFVPESIRKCDFVKVQRENKRLLETRFLVKWRGYPDNKATMEPIENLVECPELLLEFDERRQRSFRKLFSKQRLLEKRPSIPSRYLRHFKADFEYFPSGHDDVKKIVGGFEDKQISFLNVIFRGKVEVFIVRRSVMDFLFPVEVALHLKKLQLRSME